MDLFSKFLMLIFGNLPYRLESLQKCVPVLKERLDEIGYSKDAVLPDELYLRLVQEAFFRAAEKANDGVVKQRELFEEIDRVADIVLLYQKSPTEVDQRIRTIIQLYESKSGR